MLVTVGELKDNVVKTVELSSDDDVEDAVCWPTAPHHWWWRWWWWWWLCLRCFGHIYSCCCCCFTAVVVHADVDIGLLAVIIVELLELDDKPWPWWWVGNDDTWRVAQPPCCCQGWCYCCLLSLTLLLHPELVLLLLLLLHLLLLLSPTLMLLTPNSICCGVVLTCYRTRCGDACGRCWGIHVPVPLSMGGWPWRWWRKCRLRWGWRSSCSPPHVLSQTTGSDGSRLKDNTDAGGPANDEVEETPLLCWWWRCPLPQGLQFDETCPPDALAPEPQSYAAIVVSRWECWERSWRWITSCCAAQWCNNWGCWCWYLLEKGLADSWLYAAEQLSAELLLMVISYSCRMQLLRLSQQLLLQCLLST